MNNWRKGITIVAVFILAPFWLLKAQSSYRADSLQFKMYTRLFVSDQVQLDSVVVKKVFCDYCSKTQTSYIGKLGLEKTYNIVTSEMDNLNNGQHKMAVYLRVSKKDFKKINDSLRVK